MRTLDQDWLATQRAYIYRRTEDRRIQTLPDAVTFIDEVGFAFLWPIKGIEAPNLFHAIAGKERAVPMAHDDPDLSMCWGWKDQSLGSERWYYGKVLRRKATMIAPRLWGAFYALTHNYGDLNDYMEQVLDGKMTHDARLIYEALLHNGPMGTVRLRKTVGLASKEHKSRFEKALVELQTDMKIVPVGITEEGAWRYSFMIDIAMRRYPELPDEARKYGTGEAWHTLIGTYIDAVVIASDKQIKQVFHVFEPTKRELARAVEVLAEQGRIEQVALSGDDGKSGTMWASSAGL